MLKAAFNRQRVGPTDRKKLIAGIHAQASALRLPDDVRKDMQQKLVGVARAVASSPRIVCLDEPAAGLDSGESQALGEHLRKLVDDGTSMLLVDHDMGLVLSICDYVVVLEFGKVIGRGTPAEVRNDDRVIQAYLGESAKSEHFQEDVELLKSGGSA